MSSIDDGREPATSVKELAAPDGPAGIGGWLLLAAAGMLLGIFALPAWLAHQLLDPENQTLFREYPLAMYGELALNLVTIALVLVSTLLLFRKSRYFPRVFILACIASVLVPILSLAWVALAFSTQLGRPIGPNDLLIAAHALALDATLVTDNESEFRRVPGLVVENWLKSAHEHE